jgi:hypothetical protein
VPVALDDWRAADAIAPLPPAEPQVFGTIK